MFFIRDTVKITIIGLNANDLMKMPPVVASDDDIDFQNMVKEEKKLKKGMVCCVKDDVNLDIVTPTAKKMKELEE
jgi:hypothetical protein